MSDRTTASTTVCALFGVFCITLWTGAAFMMLGLVRRPKERCFGCVEDDYLDSADDGDFTAPFPTSWRHTMPIQRGGDSGNENPRA